MRLTPISSLAPFKTQPLLNQARFTSHTPQRTFLDPDLQPSLDGPPVAVPVKGQIDEIKPAVWDNLFFTYQSSSKILCLSIPEDLAQAHGVSSTVQIKVERDIARLLEERFKTGKRSIQLKIKPQPRSLWTILGLRPRKNEVLLAQDDYLYS